MIPHLSHVLEMEKYGFLTSNAPLPPVRNPQYVDKGLIIDIEASNTIARTIQMVVSIDRMEIGSKG